MKKHQKVARLGPFVSSSITTFSSLRVFLTGQLISMERVVQGAFNQDIMVFVLVLWLKNYDLEF